MANRQDRVVRRRRKDVAMNTEIRSLKDQDGDGDKG
jgi:hypothetical protein